MKIYFFNRKKIEGEGVFYTDGVRIFLEVLFGFLCFLTLLLKKLLEEQMIEVGVWGQNKEKNNSSRKSHFHCR